MGTSASTVALPLLVYRSSGSAALTAAVVGLEALPYLLFGLLAGAVADRRPRKGIMVCADAGCALAMATLVLARLFGAVSPWHVLAVAFAVGCGFCWFNAAAWGAQTRLAGSRLAEANRLVWSSEIVIDVAVPAGVGLLAAVVDPTVVVAVDAVSYVVSALLVARLRGGLGPAADRRPAGRRIRTDILDGLGYLWRQPIIRVLTLAGFGLSVSVGGAVGLLVVHAAAVLHVAASDPRVGFLFTARAVGSLLAAWVLPRLTRYAGDVPASIVAYGGYAIGLVGLAVTPLFAAALVLWTAVELARFTATMNGINVRQRLTPDELQGRVNTTGRMIAWGGTPFGALVGGVLAESAGVRTAMAVLAVPAAIGLALLVASPVRALRAARKPGRRYPRQPRR